MKEFVLVISGTTREFVDFCHMASKQLPGKWQRSRQRMWNKDKSVTFINANEVHSALKMRCTEQCTVTANFVGSWKRRADQKHIMRQLKASQVEIYIEGENNWAFSKTKDKKNSRSLLQRAWQAMTRMLRLDT